MVLPPDGLGDVTEVEHPGFDGRELEATEHIFDFFGLEQPRIPLLTPEFTNPLFLILYCESLAGMGLTAPPLGGEHLSETFPTVLDLEGAKDCPASPNGPDAAPSTSRDWQLQQCAG